MNIISNTCLGARLYQINNRAYTNPFMWNIIESDSMLNLIRHFNHLNFAKIDIPISDYYSRHAEGIKDRFPPKQPLPTIFSVVIDHLVTSHYLHYRLDINYKTPTVKDIDVYYNSIWEYVFNKYIERVKRMISVHEPPLFVISTAESSYTVDKQHQLIDAINETPYKLCIITPDIPEQIINNAFIINANIKSISSTLRQAQTFNKQILSFIS